jgi:hypothetical protein
MKITRADKEITYALFFFTSFNSRDGDIPFRSFDGLFCGGGWPLGKELLVEREEKLFERLAGTVLPKAFVLLREPDFLVKGTIRVLGWMEVRNTSDEHNVEYTYRH